MKICCSFPGGPQMSASIPNLPQKLHHLLFFIQLKEECYTLVALSFGQVFYEFEDASFAEFSARFQVRRTSQDRQLFFCQTVVSILARHFVF